MFDEVARSLGAFTSEATDQLQSHAKSMGWPDGVAKSLRISEDTLRPTWPEEAEEHVLAQELGDGSTAPKPAVWSFNHSEDQVKARDVSIQPLKLAIVRAVNGMLG